MKLNVSDSFSLQGTQAVMCSLYVLIIVGEENIPPWFTFFYDPEEELEKNKQLVSEETQGFICRRLIIIKI